MKKLKLNGSMTIEMSLIIPMIMILFMGIVLTIFYFHDKNIISGAAYETAVTGSVRMRQKEEMTEAELEELCLDRLNGKCIFLTEYTVETEIDDENVMVIIRAGKSGFKVSVNKVAALTEPEKKIRDIRRIGG